MGRQVWHLPERSRSGRTSREPGWRGPVPPLRAGAKQVLPRRKAKDQARSAQTVGTTPRFRRNVRHLFRVDGAMATSVTSATGGCVQDHRRHHRLQRQPHPRLKRLRQVQGHGQGPPPRGPGPMAKPRLLGPSPASGAEPAHGRSPAMPPPWRSTATERRHNSSLTECPGGSVMGLWLRERAGWGYLVGSRLTDLNRWPSLYKSAALPLS